MEACQSYLERAPCARVRLYPPRGRCPGRRLAAVHGRAGPRQRTLGFEVRGEPRLILGPGTLHDRDYRAVRHLCQRHYTGRHMTHPAQHRTL